MNNRYGVYQIKEHGKLELVEGGFFFRGPAEQARYEWERESAELGIHNKYVVREQGSWQV